MVLSRSPREGHSHRDTARDLIDYKRRTDASAHQAADDLIALFPDPDDRHVLAAAITAGAAVIVTTNLTDFPAEILVTVTADPHAWPPGS